MNFVTFTGALLRFIAAQLLLMQLGGLAWASSWEAASSRHCNYSHCDKLHEIGVCFLMPDLPQVPYDLISPERIAEPSCGKGSETVQVSNFSDIYKYLSQLAPQCKKIKKMVLFGHGSPGQLYFRTSRPVKPENFGTFRCTAAPGVSVLTPGCNVGRSCLGALYFRRWRRAFFPRKGGSIAAPRNWALAFVPGLVPSASTSWLKLHYSPGSSSSEGNEREMWSVVRPRLFSNYRPSLLYEAPLIGSVGRGATRRGSTHRVPARIEPAPFESVEALCQDELLAQTASYRRLRNFYQKQGCAKVSSLLLSNTWLNQVEKLRVVKGLAWEYKIQQALRVLVAAQKKIKLRCKPTTEYKGYVGAF